MSDVIDDVERVRTCIDERAGPMDADGMRRLLSGEIDQEELGHEQWARPLKYVGPLRLQAGSWLIDWHASDRFVNQHGDVLTPNIIRELAMSGSVDLRPVVLDA